MKFIIILISLSILSAQALVFQAEIQERLDYRVDYSAFEKASTLKLQRMAIKDAVQYFKEEFGLILNEIDFNLELSISNDLNSKQLYSRFLLTKNTIIKEKLYLAGSLYIETTLLMKWIRERFKEQLDALNYDKEEIRVDLEKIIEYRDRIISQKKKNTEELLAAINLGMTRQEVFNVLLYFNERKVEIDSKNSRLSNDKKKRLYDIKNSYIQLEFNVEDKRLIRIINLMINTKDKSE